MRIPIFTHELIHQLNLNGFLTGFVETLFNLSE